MQKIEIHNFGPIKDAVIDIKPMLVMIGHQASGKSTIAKLIYFFETLPESFFEQYSQSEDVEIDISHYLSEIIKSKFLKIFGLRKNFSIRFTFFEDNYVDVSESNDNLAVAFSDSFLVERKNGQILYSYKSNLLNINKQSFSSVLEQQNKLNNIYQEIKKIFGNKHDDSLYIIAGRNATVGYSHTFEDIFKQSIFQRKIIGGETCDEILMLGFMKHILQMKDIFIKYHAFEGIFSTVTNEVRPLLELANNLIISILRGKYHINNVGEYILHDDISVPLNDASSGQQEAIRILQDAFLWIFQGNKLFRIVEEPEAHLFPEAQKSTIELLTLALNNKDDNNLIITTHSPYTLTVINNLIYAAKVGRSFPQKIEKIVPKELWLPTEKVAAYILKDGTAESIIDEELGEIDPESIDKISEEINRMYGKMRDIEYETE